MFLPRSVLLPGACVLLALGLTLGPAGQAHGQPAPSASARLSGTSNASPAWADLTPAERNALAPLARTWDQFSEGHKRKWIALAQNFPRLPPNEQAKLRSRMTEWAALSPRQRTDARLNFGELQQMSPDDKKAKWEAYQALSPEERRKLADGAAPKPPATAAAVRPVPAQKLATVPKPSPADGGKQPRIAVNPPAEAASAVSAPP